MNQEETKTTDSQNSSTQKYKDFTIRLVILTVVISLGITYVAETIIESLVQTASSKFKFPELQPIKTKLREALADEKTRIRLKGLLTTNPAVHYRVSIIEERSGNLAGAIDEIELALGLLEMHGADKTTRDRYNLRLQDLKRKLESASQKETKVSSKK